jgi:periplasmic divalent cation tolerance protein
MSNPIQVVTTTAEQDQAKRIASALVQQRLAACVHVLGPITSTYRWQDKVETAQEWLCIAKTSRGRYEAVEEAIRQLHSYDVPEIVAVPIVAGSRSYLDWLMAEVEPREGAG